MKTRIISGLLMVPLIAVLYFGGTLLCIFCLLIAVLGLREFYEGFSHLNIYPSKLIGYAGTAALFLFGWFFPSQSTFMLWAFGVTVASLLSLFRIEEKTLNDAMATLTGIFYVSYFAFHVVLIDRSTAPVLIWLVPFTAFGTDIFAYFVGITFGKHRLCPNISPKKSIEGSIGGTIGSIGLSAAFGALIVPELMIHCLAIGLLGAIVSQFGDLTASVFKRKMGIKDYGNLIPGHGGVLDRFDSILFTAPAVYYYILFVIAR